MGTDLKPKEYGPWGVIKLSLMNFGLEHPWRRSYIAIIVALTLGRHVIYGLEYLVEGQLSSAREIMYNSLFLLMFLNFAFHSLHFVKYFLFEKHLAKFGPRFSAHIMRNLLYTDSNKIHDIPGGQVEYFVTESAKGMAKISRQMIIGFFSKTIYFLIDLICIHHKDRSEGKMVFLSTLVCAVCITLIKIYQVRRAVVYLKQAILASYEREKVYTEAVDNLVIIKSYRTEKETTRKYEEKTTDWYVAQSKFKYQTFLNNMLYDFLCVLFKIVSTIYYLSLHTNASAKDIHLVLRISTHLLSSGAALVGLHQDLEESLAAAYCIMEYLNLAREDLSRKVRVNMFNERLEVRNVTYAARGKVIFSNVNFTLNKGDKAVLYGRNGVGKSSIFKLLLNFDDSQGDILFDGMSLRKIAMVDYRAMVTFVPQDTRLFDESVYANLVFGNNKPYCEVVAECQKMGIHDKIMMLPNGYNTVVGEFGKNINGGLRQKIFYTRAFLRDTPIYLFDEPTNNLDVAGSRFLLEYINDASYRDKTVFVICHDMEIVREFPKVFKFDENKITLEKE